MRSRRILITVLVAGGLIVPASASAATTFKNCTALRKLYPNGVAKSQAAAARTGAVLKPAVYAANRKLDRDGDGAACEK